MSSILSVSQLNKYISFKIGQDVKLKGVAVKGEISNFNVNYKSGHAYFTLKDEDSAVKCVMFSRNVDRLKFMPTNGMKALAVGNIEVYERDGVYQIVTSDLQPLGIGVLHKNIEQIKEKLSVKGVFEQSAKKPIVYMPRKIAVVTSPTGAALQDIINVLTRRFPICNVEIYPTQVQGEMASKSICKALTLADSSDCDTIILARGGGSLEDLMPFNTEEVALAIYECTTPVISAVGHETDTTIADYVADLRAPTPSAAAEQAVPTLLELVQLSESMKLKLDKAVLAYISKRESQLFGLNFSLKAFSPEKKLEANIQMLDTLSLRLQNAMKIKISNKENEFEKLIAKLTVISPLNVLDRGYSITTKDNSVVYSSKELKSGDQVDIRFRDSSCSATVN